MLGSSLPESIRQIKRPEPVLLKLFLIRSLVTGPFFPIVFLPLYFKYKTLRYEFDEDGISMSWGKFTRTEKHVSYSRIQDIHISRGLLERWLNLGQVNIQTASGSAGAEMSLIGLTNVDEIRDALYQKMRGSGEQTEDETPPDDEADEVTELLQGIRDEIQSLRNSLSKPED